MKTRGSFSLKLHTGYLVLLAGIIVLCAGCVEQTTTNSHSYLRVRKLESPQIIAENGKAKTLPAGFIKRRLEMGYPSLKDMVIGDRQYVYITDEWFDNIVAWTHDFIKTSVPNLDLINNRPVTYNETFVALASNAANISVAKRYNIKASVLIGIMRAKSIEEWGAIPADGAYRSYIVALTEKGGIVYDLRTEQRVGFEQFPNIDHMDGIAF